MSGLRKMTRKFVTRVTRGCLFLSLHAGFWCTFLVTSEKQRKTKQDEDWTDCGPSKARPETAGPPGNPPTEMQSTRKEFARKPGPPKEQRRNNEKAPTTQLGPVEVATRRHRPSQNSTSTPKGSPHTHTTSTPKEDGVVRLHAGFFAEVETPKLTPQGAEESHPLPPLFFPLRSLLSHKSSLLPKLGFFSVSCLQGLARTLFNSSARSPRALPYLGAVASRENCLFKHPRGACFPTLVFLFLRQGALCSLSESCASIHLGSNAGTWPFAFCYAFIFASQLVFFWQPLLFVLRESPSISQRWLRFYRFRASLRPHRCNEVRALPSNARQGCPS